MLHISSFERVRDFFELLDEESQSRIDDAVAALRKENFDQIYIKEVRGPIKELRVGRYRVLFCIEYSTVYLFTAFMKKTAKTPQEEIETAQKLHRLLTEEINQK